MSLFKYIGLGILGLGGISSVAALSSIRVREFIGLSSPFTEEDRQGQFLHELSKKVFRFLKDKKKGGVDQKENVIKGLKDKFNGSLESEEDTWENFKSLCEAQKQKETKTGKDVDNVYSRLCFIDNPESVFDSKGYLGEGFFNLKETISLNGNLAFSALIHSNFELGTSFNNQYPKDNPIDKFDEGYSSDEIEPTNLKQIMDEVSLAG